MASRQVLETIASGGQVWGLILILLGASLVFLSAAANRPLKKIQAVELEKERSANEAEIVALRERLAQLEYYLLKAEKSAETTAPKNSEPARVEQLAPEPAQQTTRKLQPKLEASHTEEPKVTERPASRTLTSDQVAILTKELKYFKGRKLQVNVLAGDGENDKFGQELADTIKQIGIDVDVTFGVSNVEAPPGLSIITGIRADEVQFAARVAQALISASLASRPFSMVPAQNADAAVALYINRIRRSAK